MTKKTRIKIGIVLVIMCVMGFSDWSFAAEESSDLLSIGNIINFAVSILSWIWILFATIAGKLLTNEWVSGEIFGLDSLLWLYRNMMKNIANFGLGFYFIYAIFKGLISKGNNAIEKNIKNILLRILVAGVGIQASRFATKVVIDVSTITLVAAGSFPSQMISQNEKLQAGIENSVYEFFGQSMDSINEAAVFNLFPSDSQASKLVEKRFVPLYAKLNSGDTLTKKAFLDMLMPNDENISGPLYYMGVSIMQTNNINSFKSADDQGIKESILNLIIQGGSTIVYSIEMAVLCILALMRVLYLWMFIVLSPITILILCIEKSGEKISGEKGLLSGLTKHINMKSFFINVFKPTIIVLGIGLAMMFTTLMKDVINKSSSGNGEVDLGGIKIITSPDSGAADSDDKSYTTTMKSDFGMFRISYLAKGLLDFILSIITVILVYMVIKMAVKMGDGKDFVSQKLGKIQDTVGNAITSLPVMPVAGYNSETGEKETHYISARSVFGENNNLFTRKINYYQKKVDEEYNKQTQAIRSLFGDEPGYLTSSEITNIENAGKNMTPSIAVLTEKKKAIVKTKEGKGMTLNPQTSSNNGFWINEFSAWLEGMKGQTVTGTGNNGTWNEMINRWNNKGKKDAHTLQEKSEKLQAMFGSVSNSAMAYAQYFFDSDDDRYKISTWNDLKNADISKKKSEEKSE